MKELIGTAVMIVGLFAGGTYALKKVHFMVQKAALTKVSEGIRPLPRFKKD